MPGTYWITQQNHSGYLVSCSQQTAFLGNSQPSPQITEKPDSRACSGKCLKNETHYILGESYPSGVSPGNFRRNDQIKATILQTNKSTSGDVILITAYWREHVDISQTHAFPL